MSKTLHFLQFQLESEYKAADCSCIVNPDKEGSKSGDKHYLQTNGILYGEYMTTYIFQICLFIELSQNL